MIHYLKFWLDFIKYNKNDFSVMTEMTHLFKFRPAKTTKGMNLSHELLNKNEYISAMTLLV